MNRAGLIVFLAGVTLSSWYAARLAPEDRIEASGEHGEISTLDRVAAWGKVAGIPFGIGALLMLGGGVLARRTQSARDYAAPAGAAPAGEAPAGATLAMLRQIEQAVARLPRDDPQRHVEALHDALDRILEDMVPTFLEQRAQHIANLGLEQFAETIGLFASAERNLARAWSALTDECWSEVTPCLEKARSSISAAVSQAQSG